MRRILLLLTLLVCCLSQALSQNFIYIMGPGQYYGGNDWLRDPLPPCEKNKDAYENCKMFETAPGSGIYTGDFFFGDGSWTAFRFYTKLYDGDDLQNDWDSCLYNVIYSTAEREFEKFLETNELGIATLKAKYNEVPPADWPSTYWWPYAWILPGYKGGWYHIEVDTNTWTVTADNGDALYVVGSTTNGKFPTYDTIDDFKDVAITSACPDRRIEIGDNKFSVFYYSLAHNEVIMAPEDNEIVWEDNIYNIKKAITTAYSPGMAIKPWKANGWTKGTVAFTKDGFINYSNIGEVYLAPEGCSWSFTDDSNLNYLTLRETEAGSHIYKGAFPASYFDNLKEYYISIARNNKYGNMSRINGDGRVIFDPNGRAADVVTMACEGKSFMVPELVGDDVTITLDLNNKTCVFEADKSNASDYKIFMCNYTPDCERTYANVAQFKDWMMWPATKGAKVYHGDFNLAHRPFECYISDRLSDTPGKVYLPDGETKVTVDRNKLDCKATTKLTDERWKIEKWMTNKFTVTLDEEDLSVSFPQVYDALYLVGDITGWTIDYDRYYNGSYPPCILKAVAPKVYEGTFDVTNPWNLYFRFFTDLGNWEENSIGPMKEEDIAFDFTLTNGVFSGTCYDGKGAWHITDWSGNKIQIRVNLNDYTVQFCDPEIASLSTIATEMYLVGDITDWKCPEAANAEHYEDFKLTQTEPGKFTGTFDIPADKANFHFYTKLDGWESHSIGGALVDDDYEHYFTDESFADKYVDGGKGAWKFPYWEGGPMEMMVDTHNGSVRFSKGNVEVSIEAPVNTWLTITGTNGQLTISTDRETCVDIYTPLGIKVKSVNVLPGITTVQLPHGFYIVAGTKIIL